MTFFLPILLNATIMLEPKSTAKLYIALLLEYGLIYHFHE